MQNRIRDRPVHHRRRANFLVREIANGDNQVPVVPDIADMLRPRPGQRQVVPLRGGDRPRVDRRGRMGAGRHGRDFASSPPQCRRQMRTCRVGGAHEKQPPGRRQCRASWQIQYTRFQPEVGTPPVTVGAAAGNQPCFCEHVQVVGEEVRWHRQHRGQF